MYDVHPGDVLVLCSDGLWSVLEEGQIAQVVSVVPPQQACDELVRLANTAGEDENISVVILSFSGTLDMRGRLSARSET